MAKILSQDSIRFNIDTLKTEKHALIVMKAGHFLDCTNTTSINGFNISYSQPTNTRIAFLFTTGDTLDNSQMYAEGETHSGEISDDTARGAWFKLTASGYARLVESTSLTYESVIEYGNTISELQALTNIPAFKGYRVRVAIALLSTDSVYAPSVSLSIKATNTTQQTSKTEYSPLYEIGENGQIINITANSTVSNNGTISIQGDINESGNWQNINALAGQDAKTLQLRAIMNAPQVNSSTVTLSNVNIIYSPDSGIINGDGTSEIISTTHNWYKPIKYARVVVKHEPLKDSNIKVYASFRAKPSICEGEILGTGDGATHTYLLKNKSGLNLDSIKIFYDNEQIFSGYSANCEAGQIICNAPAGVIITCNYEFGWSNEEWQELNFRQLTRKPDYDESEYYLKNSQVGYICAIKIALQTRTGNISNEVIGTGKGRSETYKLSHPVKEGNITITANNSALSANNFYIMEDPQFIKISATSGATLRASYTWISEPPIIYEFHGVFNE